MTDAQMDKREKIVKSLKKKKDEFESRYGKDSKPFTRQGRHHVNATASHQDGRWKNDGHDGKSVEGSPTFTNDIDDVKCKIINEVWTSQSPGLKLVLPK